MTQAVLFDLDGTLADTAPDLAAALNQLLKAERRPEKPFAQLRRHASFGARGMVGAGFGEDLSDTESERLIKRFLAIYKDHLHERTRLFPGARQTLRALRQKGTRWGIVTNKSGHLAEPLLRHLGIFDDADCLVYGDTTACKKPSPEPLLHAARQLGLGARDCVYVGDSLRDVEAAHNANMPVLAVAYGYRPEHEDLSQWNADAVLDDVAELIAWLDSRPHAAGQAPACS